MLEIIEYKGHLTNLGINKLINIKSLFPRKRGLTETLKLEKGAMVQLFQ